MYTAYTAYIAKLLTLLTLPMQWNTCYMIGRLCYKWGFPGFEVKRRNAVEGRTEWMPIWMTALTTRPPAVLIIGITNWRQLCVWFIDYVYRKQAWLQENLDLGREGVRIRSGCRRCAARQSIKRSEKAQAEMYINVLKGVKLRPPAGNMSSNVGAGRPWG